MPPEWFLLVVHLLRPLSNQIQVTTNNPNGWAKCQELQAKLKQKALEQAGTAQPQPTEKTK
jgi:hypothetical protein